MLVRKEVRTHVHTPTHTRAHAQSNLYKLTTHGIVANQSTFTGGQRMEQGLLY